MTASGQTQKSSLRANVFRSSSHNRQRAKRAEAAKPEEMTVDSVFAKLKKIGGKSEREENE